ncbi:type II toxin-antitoxin system RelE/ParE family toxin [bacterium]|nr:type II toxin-antitoxin system RelE/ParE family toxin [bacterium]
MKKVSITPKTRADLRDISRYTDQKWGRQQRFKYLKQLGDCFAFLAETPQMGKKRDEIVGAPFSYHEGRHVIFYRATAEGIEILRVLHDAMDFPRHFK